MTDSVLFVESGFTASLRRKENGIPVALNILAPEGTSPVLSVPLDAVDGMSFCDAGSLARQPGDVQAGAAKCLKRALDAHYGGKNMLSVPDALASVFAEAGFQTSPATPTGEPYKRLMAASLDKVAEQIHTRFERRKDSNTASMQLESNRYRVETDPAVLAAPVMAEKLSRLFLDNADYAAGPVKSPLYTPAAMQARIQDPQVHSVALLDMKTGEPVGFLRSFTQENLGSYLSDFVVNDAQRNTGIALQLMESSLSHLKATHPGSAVFLIAGNEKEQGYYRSTLSFQPVAERGSPTRTQGGQFMFTLQPQQAILKELSATLAAQPAGAKTATPYADALSQPSDRQSGRAR